MSIATSARRSRFPPSHGPVNDAMHAAESRLLRDWLDIVYEWEGTR